jgi:isoquinoline 1-oxidoreductase beta subunit
VHEGFWDELAVAAGKDPVVFRLEHMRAHAADPRPAPTEDGEPALDIKRLIPVLETVAERSGWSRARPPAGTGMGVAAYFSHRGYFAEVAQVRVAADGTWKVEKVWVVGDVGSIILNPITAQAQVQGAVIEGIGQLLGEVTFEAGRAQQSNLYDFKLMRLSMAPEIDVHFMVTDNPPTGMGEPALPPAVSAVVNAVQAACGARIRTLPMTPERIQAARADRKA